jgi:hypothetical protein
VLSDAPVSISKAKLLMPLEDLRSKLHALIADSEQTQETVVTNWHALEEFQTEKDGWRDCCHELLVHAFESREVADAFLTAMSSGMTGGTIQEWVSDGKRSIVRGIGYLRSIEKRLILIQDIFPDKRAAPAAGNRNPDLIEKIQKLKTILIDHVTGHLRDESEYRTLKDEIRSHQELSPLLPKSFRDWSDLGSAWDSLKKFKHYAERRTLFAVNFSP